MKAPFQNNDSNVYHVLHGTTNKGASLILAEELIRPGDFTMHKNPAKCGYPSYGFYSAGEVAAKTIQFSYSLKELSRNIWRLAKEPSRFSLEGSTRDAILTSTKCQEGMKRFNVFVENMVLPEEKKNTRWQDQNIPLFMAWWSRTRMLLKHLVVLLDLESSFVATMWAWSYCESLLFCLWY